MDHFFMVLSMALVTFLIRYILLPLSGRYRLPPSVQAALGFVPPAVLTAIIVPAALFPDGQHLQLSYTNPYLMGAIFTAAIGWTSRNLLLTISGGMAGFLLWQTMLSSGWLGG